MTFEYFLNQDAKIEILGNYEIPLEKILDAVHMTNENIHILNEISVSNGVNLFDILGLRNLSGFVGELFTSQLERVLLGDVSKNPHQDGYPDLLLTHTDEYRTYFQNCTYIKNEKIYAKSKELFSPYKYEGFEVKATCGSTPPAKKIPKPAIGEQRIELMNSFDWKAHHQDTNNLIGLLWDFIDGQPVIVSVFFRNDLTRDDWREPVEPKEDGGRTTSVCMMKTSGLKRMYEGWALVLDDTKYIEKLSNKKWIGKELKQKLDALCV